MPVMPEWRALARRALRIPRAALRLWRDARAGKVLWLEFPPSYDCRPRWGHSRPAHPGLERLFDRNKGGHLRALREMAGLMPWLDKIPIVYEGGTEPGWVNPSINAIDVALLYYFVWKSRPRTYVEIGSGVTTLFAARARRDHGLATRIVSIDPCPRAPVDAVCDHVERQPLEVCDLSVFDALVPGDIVFMDGSHRTFMNSDVTVFMLDIVPRLAPGVLIHVHDVHLPFDYPDLFVSHFWSEQYLLAAYLLGAAERVEVLMPSRHVSQWPELPEVLAPLVGGIRHSNIGWLMGGSLWFTHAH